MNSSARFFPLSLLYFPLLVRCWRVGWIFFIALSKSWEENREKTLIARRVLLKEQHSARKTRLKNGKIDNVFILAESQAEGYYPLSLASNLPLIQTVFLSGVDCRLQNSEGEMKSGDKFCSRSALFAPIQMHENFRWKICFLWTQCTATREGKQKKKKDANTKC